MFSFWCEYSLGLDPARNASPCSCLRAPMKVRHRAKKMSTETPSSERRSNTISMFVCLPVSLFVCLSASISQKPYVQNSPNFMRMFSMAITSVGGVIPCSVGIDAHAFGYNTAVFCRWRYIAHHWMHEFAARYRYQ